MRKKGCTQYKTAASSKNRSRFIMHPTGRVKQGEINIRRLLHPKIGGKLFPCTQEKTLTFVSRSASFCGGELGIRTLGGLTLTAFRVLPAIPTIPENSGICEKFAELDKPLENTEFFAPLRRKFRRHQGFEPFPKSAQKAAFWRDFGEKTTVWREVRREKERTFGPLPSAVDDQKQDGE